MVKKNKKNKRFNLSEYKITKNLKDKRIFLVTGVIWLLLVILVLRLSYIMIFKHKEYGAMAEEQWKNEVKISAKRGEILDRNGAQLAVSANVYRVDLDLKTIRETYFKKNFTEDDKKEELNELAEKLSTALNMEKADIYDKLNLKLSF